MRIAVASGKGGTGKTTVSTNLARVMSRSRRVQYVDCDVEEPNGHLFLHPVIKQVTNVEVPVPGIDAEKCIDCGECSRVCRYKAIACLGNTTITFPELCHGCGGCTLICPVDAITEVGRMVGVVEQGDVDGIEFIHGRLNVGEAMSPPLIRAVASYIDTDATVIIDAPPGTSCPVVASLRNADVVVLVAEPTAFGLHDLTLAVETVREMSIPFGVFINRSDIGDDRVERFCAENNVPVWGTVPHDRRIAEAYSDGRLAVDALPDTAAHFESLAQILLREWGTMSP